MKTTIFEVEMNYTRNGIHNIVIVGGSFWPNSWSIGQGCKQVLT